MVEEPLTLDQLELDGIEREVAEGLAGDPDFGWWQFFASGWISYQELLDQIKAVQNDTRYKSS